MPGSTPMLIYQEDVCFGKYKGRCVFFGVSKSVLVDIENDL